MLSSFLIGDTYKFLKLIKYIFLMPDWCEPHL